MSESSATTNAFAAFRSCSTRSPRPSSGWTTFADPEGNEFDVIAEPA